jgi:serine/threonine-protein kinase
MASQTVQPVAEAKANASEAKERQGTISTPMVTDGKWIAYTSDESGRFEVYVRPYPGPGQRHQVSTAGGEEPLWSADGDELFYRYGRRWMAVPIQAKPDFSAGKPQALFEGPYPNVPGLSYGVARDGRFLVVRETEGSRLANQINVVLNWFEELRRLAPIRK